MTPRNLAKKLRNELGPADFPLAPLAAGCRILEITARIAAGEIRAPRAVSAGPFADRAAGARIGSRKYVPSMGSAAGSGAAAAGGSARHTPVLLRAALDQLNLRAGAIYVDGTFGGGGYTRAILSATEARVIGIDRDRTAVAMGAELVQAAGGRLTLVEERFSALDEVARRQGHAAVDGVVLDLGVSSMQLDTAERGFSFRLDGPLDMRMSGEGPTAADVVARAGERELTAIISTLGEERFARPIARAIVRARGQAPIVSTRALADIITRVVHPRPNLIHPATRTFQALRIFVNEELAELAEALNAAERILKPGGRLVVISFHSLEDRIVKTFLTERGRTAGISRHRPETAGPAPTFRILTKKPVEPDETEEAANPRARSAKLRAGERTAAPAHAAADVPPLPRLPSLADVMKGG